MAGNEWIISGSRLKIKNDPLKTDLYACIITREPDRLPLSKQQRSR